MMPNQTTLRILFYKYRDFLLPVGLLCLCACIIGVVLVPLAITLVNDVQRIQQTRLEIAALQKNLSVIESYDSSQLQLQTNILYKALPASKDFGAVIDTLQRAATASHVTLSDYTFQVGDLSDAKKTTPGKIGTFQVTIVLVGNAQSVMQFVQALTHQLPLSDISDIKGSNTNTAMTLLFSYQPQTPVTVQATDTFTPLSAQENETMRTLAVYDKK